MEGALFVQQLRTEKQTGNVASAQNGCARTIQIKCDSCKEQSCQRQFHSHLCSKIYFLVLKHFKYFILCNCM